MRTFSGVADQRRQIRLLGSGYREYGSFQLCQFSSKIEISYYGRIVTYVASRVSAMRSVLRPSCASKIIAFAPRSPFVVISSAARSEQISVSVRVQKPSGIPRAFAGDVSSRRRGRRLFIWSIT